MVMISHLLFVIHSPVTSEVCKLKNQRVRESKNAHFVVITSPQINHDVLVPGVWGVRSLLTGSGSANTLTGRRT